MKSKEFIIQLKSLTEAELRERARSLSEELMKLRFRKASGQLQQTHRLGEIRRNLARVETALKQKAMAAIPGV
ncbi:MAG: 50S ribosomal protein L29 [Proteobacteria bacterium]|nr:50S ribosomal protein L29 [Pseudomonadota bacterium]